MHGTIGDRIGEGATAEVYAWAPGRVVKLYKVGISRQLGMHEARMTRAVFVAGGPAPEVLEEVTIDGRFGIVLPRLDGPSLLQLARTGGITFEQAGAVMAAIALSVHRVAPSSEIYTLEDTMTGLLKRGGDGVPVHIASGISTYLERLPAGDKLCHADLHPGNVLMTADGPRLIDWTGAVRAAPAFDLALSQVLLSELIPQRVDDPMRPQASNVSLQLHYAQFAGIADAALHAAVADYLPVARVYALLVGSWSAERQPLFERVEASLRGSE